MLTNDSYTFSAHFYWHSRIKGQQRIYALPEVNARQQRFFRLDRTFSLDSAGKKQANSEWW